MDKEQAFLNAQEVIQNLILDQPELEPNQESSIFLSQKHYDADPNLEILKQELNKIGYSISKSQSSKVWWDLKKL